jgi:hypothetical protein
MNHLISTAAHTFQDKDELLRRIATKVHAAADDALRIALKGEMTRHIDEKSVKRNAPAVSDARR